MNCGQTTIPEVDNSDQACLEYINDECIIVSEGLAFLGTMPNTSLKQVLIKLVEKLNVQSRLIKDLQNKINE